MKNTFLETWFGKTILIAFTYIIYWLVFYGSWFLMPEEWFLEYDHSNYVIKTNVIFALLFLIIPIFSYFIPHYLSKKIQVNKIILYIIHTVLILVSLWLFLHFALTLAFKHFSIG